MLKKLRLVPLFAATCASAQTTQQIPTKAHADAAYIHAASATAAGPPTAPTVPSATWVVSDALTPTDCTVGHDTERGLCTWEGTIQVPLFQKGDTEVTGPQCVPGSPPVGFITGVSSDGANGLISFGAPVMPPVTPTTALQTADKNYVDRRYPCVTSDGANGLSVAGNAPASRLYGSLGLLSSSFWGNGTNNLAGFFNNAIYCNGAAKPCAAIADPAYAATEQYSGGYTASSNFSPGPSQSVLADFRSGSVKLYIHDPALNGSNYNDSLLFTCANTTFQGFVGSGNSAESNCLHIIQQQHEPGFSLGNPSVGPGGWSVTDGLRLERTVNTPGISQLYSGFQSKPGTGDSAGVYVYNFSYGGATAPSDEGNELSVFQGGEAAATYAGTVTAGGAGATAVVVNCNHDCSNPGDGRYLIDTHAAVATGNITAATGPSGSTPGTVTTDSTVRVSPFWGSLNANVATPNATPLGTGSTAMTFAVTKLGGAGAPASGDLLCFAGQFHEQAKITSVTGSGPYTITANLRHAHQASSWVMDGGACGTFIELTGIDQTPQGQLLRFPVDVIGSTNANTLVYSYFQGGSSALVGITGAGVGAIPANNLTNVGNVVTFTLSGKNRVFSSGPSAYFSSASDSAFNGPCTNLHAVSFQAPNHATFACTQTASNGHGGPATANVAWGTTQYGNNQFNLWAGAEVLDVQDYTTSPPSIDGHLTLEPNTAAWTAGDTVEQPHHYAAHMSMANNLLSIFNPSGINNSGHDLTFFGAGISGSQEYNITTMAASHITNLNNPNIYAGHGGYLSPPNGFAFAGPWTSYIATALAPEATFAYIGAPANGTNDPTASYNLFEANTVFSGQFPIMSYRPFQNVLLVNTITSLGSTDAFSAGGNITFPPLAAPSNLGSFATTGGQLPDSTTYFYHVVATDNASNPSARSSEISVTTGTNSGNNRIRLMWTRSPGATGYTVCRGSTSGSEQVIEKNPGGDNGNLTYFDDMGNLAPSGTCPNPAAGIRGGIEQASYLGVNSPDTSFEAKVVAPSLSGNVTITLPNTTSTLATTAQITSSLAPYAPLPLSGTTGSIGGSALTAGQCTSGTATIAGVSSHAQVPVASPTKFPGSGFIWQAYVQTGNTISVEVCALVAGTPAASTYNVRVFQ